MIIIIFTCSIVINLSIKSANGFANDIKNIYFGQTIDLDNNQVASEYFKGFHLAFQSINRIGGIDGYKINIILLNDKYDKELAVKNAILLTDYYNVLALIGLFGTTTITNVIESVVNNKNIPLIAPFSGSTVIKKNFTKNIILTNGSNNQEFKLLFDLLRKKKIKNIGIIYQNDDYGYSYLNNFINQIMIFKEELNILSAASYERNSINLYSTYIKLFNLSSPYLENYIDKNNKLEAVILFCTETQISNILATLKKINPSLLIYYGFFTGNNKLNYKVVGNNTENVYQSLLSYNIEKFPILYKKFIEEVEYYNNFGKGDQITNINKIIDFSNTLYQGFYSGLLIVEVLKSFKNPGDITREEFINKFYEIKNFNIYGLHIGPFILNKSNNGVNYASLNKIINQNLEIISEINNDNHVYGEYNNHVYGEHNYL
jgi:ABC-type branched-subunit amino acid transport system substrate-binding protein